MRPPTGGAGWRSLGVSAMELRLAYTLPTGQAFQWVPKGEREWVGALGQEYAVGLRESPESNQAEWRADPSADMDKIQAKLWDYFQLDIELGPLYAEWSEKDERAKSIAHCIPGARVLRQDPLECLISFICSSNNNISRISLMLKRLRRELGTPLTLEENDDIYAFPTLSALAACPEERLRELGFGYRAPYVVETSRQLIELGGNDFLFQLRQEKDRNKVRTALTQLKGIGPKVADCVALFCLDQTDAVPVDTHVWRLARRDYDPSLREAKSLTLRLYDQVGDSFRNTFGTHAGWALSLLFCAELPALAHTLPETLLLEMKQFKQEEKLLNAEKKKLKAVTNPSTTQLPSTPTKKKLSLAASSATRTPKKRRSTTSSHPPSANLNVNHVRVKKENQEDPSTAMPAFSSSSKTKRRKIKKKTTTTE